MLRLCSVKNTRWLLTLSCALVLVVLAQSSFAGLDARTPSQFGGEPPVNLQPAEGQRFRVDLLTVDPGREFYSVWGHTALRLYDSETGRDVTFDYGLFQPDPLFLLKFLKNQPAYLLWVSSLNDSLHQYRRLNRSVHAQQIFMSDAEAEALLRRLAINSLPQNRTYAYHHYRNNCTTRLRDILDEDIFAGATQRIYEARENNTDLRELASDPLDYDPAYWIAINLIQGTLVDQPVNAWQEMFLPHKYMHYLDEWRQTPEGAARIGPIQTLQTAAQPVDTSDGALAWTLFFLIWAALIALCFAWPAFFSQNKADSPSARIAYHVGQVSRYAWYIGAGLGGVLLAFLWFYAEQDSLDNNLNLLAYCPLLLVMLVLPIFRRRADYAKWNLRAHLFFVALTGLGVLLAITTLHPQFAALFFLLPALLIQALIYRFVRTHSTAP